mgnify:CR=1 FL=1|jgi:hypothetical protein
MNYHAASPDVQRALLLGTEAVAEVKAQAAAALRQAEAEHAARLEAVKKAAREELDAFRAEAKKAARNELDSYCAASLSATRRLGDELNLLKRELHALEAEGAAALPPQQVVDKAVRDATEKTVRVCADEWRRTSRVLLNDARLEADARQAAAVADAEARLAAERGFRVAAEADI